MESDHSFCSQYTSTLARDSLLASVSHRPLQIIMELERPWARACQTSLDFPKQALPLISKALKQQVKFNICGVEPAAMLRESGCRRYIIVRPSDRLGFDYQRHEYLVEQDCEADFWSFVLGFSEQFGHKACSTSRKRDVLVCVHGERDRCCERYGNEIYEHLLKAPLPSNIQIWKSTHIGGHRFAPTLFEVPDMRAWGLLNKKQGEAICRRDDTAFEEVIAYDRGFMGLKNVCEQLVEHQAFRRHAWNWFERRNLVVTSQLYQDQLFKVDLSYVLKGKDYKIKATVSLSEYRMVLASCYNDALQKVMRPRIESLSWSA